MKCIVFAYSQLGYDCLQYLVSRQDHQVCLVITHHDNPNEAIWFDSVERLAAENGIDVITPQDLKDTQIVDLIQSYKADVIFSFYYRLMIPQIILDSAPLGAYNIHGSLLPRYRGRCPVNWAIIHGETSTGVTLHQMERSADTGDVVGQLSVDIGPDDTAGQITQALNKFAVELLHQHVDGIATQTHTLTPQDHTVSNYFGGRTPQDGKIDWSQSAVSIHNLVRALSPHPQYPPAFAVLEGRDVKIMKSCIRLSKTNITDTSTVLRRPGDVISQHTDLSITVACGESGSDQICVWLLTE